MVRPITIKDYKELIEFWKENYLITPLDEFERIKLFLEKNPNLSLVAEEEGIIVGTVLGSFDGRRGSLQKLVVSKKVEVKELAKSWLQKQLKRSTS